MNRVIAGTLAFACAASLGALEFGASATLGAAEPLALASVTDPCGLDSPTPKPPRETTAPLAPQNPRIIIGGDGEPELAWDSEPLFESGPFAWPEPAAALDSPGHAFFREQTSRPVCSATSTSGCVQGSWSLRDQCELERLMQKDVVYVLASSGNPATVTAGYNGVSIVASSNGVVTTAENHNLFTGDKVHINGHSVAALNGSKTVTALTSRSFLVDGVSGEGSGGTSYKYGHRCFHGGRITLTGHGAIPDGTYVISASKPYSNTFTIPGVASTGGGAQGTFQCGIWEYMGPQAEGGTGRTDTYPNPQDAAKVVFPHTAARVMRQLNGFVLGGITDDFLVSWDMWYGREFKTGTANAFGTHKAFQVSKGASYYGGPRNQFAARDFPIARSVAGSNTIETGFRHTFVTGDRVTIAGHSSVPDGDYAVTVTSDTSFTIPYNITADGKGGTVENVLDISRVDMFVADMGPLQWSLGVIKADGYYPTGPEGAVREPGKGSVPIRWGVWTRYWVQVRQNRPGTEFTAWNTSVIEPLFGRGAVAGQRAITCTVAGTTATCTSKIPHGYVDGTNASTLTLSGITGMSGVRTVASVPATECTGTRLDGVEHTGPCSFTIEGVTGSGGSGVATQHFNELTVWIADENRDPVKVLDRVPTAYGPAAFNRFIHEHDSSIVDSDKLPNNDMIGYARNVFVLRNVAADGTLLRRPIR